MTNSGRAHHDPNKSNDKRMPFGRGESQQHQPIVDAENKLVYENKHWESLEKLDPNQVDNIKMGESPVTKMEKEGVCDGVLRLSGSMVEKHKEEIMNAIKHSEQMAIEKDPTNKIVNIEENGADQVTIYTAKNQLAVTMGKKIDSAFKGGSLEIKWSEDDKPSDVKWHKDL